MTISSLLGFNTRSLAAEKSEDEIRAIIESYMTGRLDVFSDGETLELAGVAVLETVTYINNRVTETNANLYNKTANAGDGNFTKYGVWYGNNGEAWCATFVSWCANQAGVSTCIIPKYEGI